MQPGLAPVARAPDKPMSPGRLTQSAGKIYVGGKAKAEIKPRRSARLRVFRIRAGYKRHR